MSKTTAAFLLCALVPLSATAAPVTFNFSGQANPEQIVEGRFNAIADNNETIQGSLTFDDVLFAQLSSSYFAIQEYPAASISYMVTRTVGSETFQTLVQSESVIQQTPYDDLRLVTNLGSSALNFSNVVGGIYDGAHVSFRFDGQVNGIDDLLGTINQISVSYVPCPNCFVFAYYTDVQFTQVAAIPEPETYALLLAGLALLGFGARRGRTSNAASS